MLTGKCNALHRALPQAPVLADLPGAKSQVSTASPGVGAVALDLITGERATGLWIEGMQADQYLVDHLFVTEGLQQTGVVTRQVDHHVGATFECWLDP
ncbi:hypothetical protein D3C79_730980 [compost metagenome]